MHVTYSHVENYLPPSSSPHYHYFPITTAWLQDDNCDTTRGTGEATRAGVWAVDSGGNPPHHLLWVFSTRCGGLPLHIMSHGFTWCSVERKPSTLHSKFVFQCGMEGTPCRIVWVFRCSVEGRPTPTTLTHMVPHHAVRTTHHIPKHDSRGGRGRGLGNGCASPILQQGTLLFWTIILYWLPAGNILTWQGGLPPLSHMFSLMRQGEETLLVVSVWFIWHDEGGKPSLSCLFNVLRHDREGFLPIVSVTQFDMTRGENPPRCVCSMLFDATGRVSPPCCVCSMLFDVTGSISPPRRVYVTQLNVTRGETLPVASNWHYSTR